MKIRFLFSFTAVLLSTGLAIAQAPPEEKSGPPKLTEPPAPVENRQSPSPRPLPELEPASARNLDPGPDSAPWLSWEEEGDSCQGMCGPPGRFWGSVDYLLWFFKGYSAPPLLTTGTPATGGILGPGTSVLSDGSNVNNPYSGFRFNLGVWLNQRQTIGLVGGGLWVGPGSRDYGAAGNGAAGSATIGRPFFNASSGQEDSELVALPGFLSGNANVHSSSRIAGGQINGLFNLCCGCGYRLDALGGFQYFQLNEGLGITESLAVLPSVAGFGGSRFALFDQFDTANHFYGGQMGLRGMVYRGRFFVLATGALALGVVDEVVDINGGTIITSASGATTTGRGGLFALPSNMGHYSQSRFAVLPQTSIDVGFFVTRSVFISVGYSFMYLSNVVRPGDQIDRVLNLTQAPSLGTTSGLVGPARPAFHFQQSDFWAQGLQFGLGFWF